MYHGGIAETSGCVELSACREFGILVGIDTMLNGSSIWRGLQAEPGVPRVRLDRSEVEKYAWNPAAKRDPSQQLTCQDGLITAATELCSSTDSRLLLVLDPVHMIDIKLAIVYDVFSCDMSPYRHTSLTRQSVFCASSPPSHRPSFGPETPPIVLTSSPLTSWAVLQQDADGEGTSLTSCTPFLSVSDWAWSSAII